MNGSAAITINPIPSANAGIDKSIAGCTDSVQIGGSPTASSGTSPYTYSWSPTGGLSSSTVSNPFVRGISTNTTYTVTATDSRGCTAGDQVLVSVTGSDVAVSISPSGPTTWCAGSGGSVTFTANATGTRTPFTYQWTGTSISPLTLAVATANPSTAGSYTYRVTVTDAAGCTALATTSVTVNASPTTFNVTGGGQYCSGGTGVSIGLSNSQVGVNYQLILNGVTNIGSPIAGTGSAISFGNQLTAGTYTVRATNASSCSILMTGSAVVTINPLPTASAGADENLINCGGDSVQIGGSPSASGGTSPYTYSWSPSGGLSSVSSSNPFVRGISSNTTYTLIVTDSRGCTASDAVLVNVSGSTLAASISAGGPTTWCAGSSSNVVLTANVSGGTTPYTYPWSSWLFRLTLVLIIVKPVQSDSPNFITASISE